MFKRKFIVQPNYVGLLFKESQLLDILDAGHYRHFDFFNKMKLVELPIFAVQQYASGQEVLSKDKIAFRFSFFFSVKLVDIETYIKQFDISNEYATSLMNAKNLIHRKIQVHLRSKFGALQSDEIASNDKSLFAADEDLKNECLSYGFELLELMVIDISFPKRIQELFSKHLEAQQKAKADLELARSTVATARALKNAAKIIDGDEQVKFIQTMETINKIAEQGKHTFIFGDITNGQLKL